MASPHVVESRPGGGRRGLVTTFSAASRRRMLRALHSVNRFALACRPILVTLTYPGVWLQKPADVSRNRRAICARLKRLGRVSVFWRIEYQRRGAPHLHLLVFGVSDPEILRETVPEAWFVIVGTKNQKHRARGCDVRATNGWRGVTAYLSKYLAKPPDDDADPVDHQGRWWGIESRDHLPVEPVCYKLLVAQGIKARRWALRAAGRSHRHRGPVTSDTVFLDSGAVERMVSYLRRDGPGGDRPDSVAERLALRRWYDDERQAVAQEQA